MAVRSIYSNVLYAALTVGSRTKDFSDLCGCDLFVPRGSLSNPDGKIRFLITTEAYAAWWHAHRKPLGPKRFAKRRALATARIV